MAICNLIVTVDTEEEGLWNGEFRVRDNTVTNIRGIPRFQAFCDQFGVRPTYLVDSPVAENDEAVGVLRAIFEDDKCEIGAHLHPWCAPPISTDNTPRDSYLCNLPESLQRDKLVGLTELIEERFGRRPTSFRAGRYGLDARGARILADLGYLVDSSVLPFTDYSAQGGPNFESAPHQPYFVDGDDLTTPHEAGFILEVPVSVGFSRPDFPAARRWRQWAMRSWPRRLRMVGLLDRLGVARRIKFSPEQSTAAEMKALVDAYLAQGARCMVMMLHSSSLAPGHTPYVRNAEQLEEFYRALSETLRYCCEACQMVGCTLTEVAQRPSDGVLGLGRQQVKI